MKITDALYGEHGLFYPMFNYTEALLNEGSELTEIKTALRFLGSIIIDHADFEEEVLFPKLEPFLGQAGPLAVMRSEHEKINELFEQAINAKTIETLTLNTRLMLDLLRGHFAKEEQVLFAITQKVLDEETQLRLGDKWAEHRGVSIADRNTQTCFG